MIYKVTIQKSLPNVFCIYGQDDSKIYIEMQNSHLNNFERENKVGEITVPDFKTYCKAVVITLYSTGVGHTDWWNKIESSEMEPCQHEQLIFSRDAKVI